MKSVLISAGHGGSDPGATGNGYIESTLALKLRDRVYKHLVAFRVDVLRDGNEGENNSLRKAISICRIVDIGVELHFNGSTNESATGVEALSKPENMELAQKLCYAVTSSTGLCVRGNDLGWKSDSSGQHHRLGFCEAGGIILEVCFITNKDDMKLYVENKLQVALEIAKVLNRYVRK